MMKTNSIEQFFDVVETVTDDLVTTIRNEQNNNGRVQNLYQLLGRWSQEGKYKNINVDVRIIVQKVRSK